MPETTLVYDVSCHPDTAFALVTDPNRLREWRTVDSVRVAPAGSLRVGSRLDVRVSGGLKIMRFSHEVSLLDRAKREYADRAVGGPFLVEHGWSVAPHGAGSRVRWTVRYRLRGPSRLLRPIFSREIGRSQRAEGERLKRLLEGEFQSP